MQSRDEIKRCVADTRASIETQFKHISLRNYPFEDNIIKIIPTKGLFYSEDYWLDHLFYITEKGYYFTNDDIFNSIPDENQPYADFLRGILKIAKVVKFNEDFDEMPKFILSIMKHGRITGISYTQGYNTGKKKYLYCHRYYSWIGSKYRDN